VADGEHHCALADVPAVAPVVAAPHLRDAVAMLRRHPLDPQIGRLGHVRVDVDYPIHGHGATA
jgi:hypothetical protein